MKDILVVWFVVWLIKSIITYGQSSRTNELLSSILSSMESVDSNLTNIGSSVEEIEDAQPPGYSRKESGYYDNR